MKLSPMLACALLAACTTTAQSTSPWSETSREAQVEREAALDETHVRSERQKKLAHQNRLLGEARAHEKACDYERSLQCYRELMESDKTSKLAPLLEHHIATVDARRQAVVKARGLALDGRHAEASVVLEKQLGLRDAAGVALPWSVVTFPAGARARFEDGTERVTPFTVESARGERVRFTLTLAGYESQVVTVEHPGDQSVQLSPLSACRTSW